MRILRVPFQHRFLRFHKNVYKFVNSVENKKVLTTQLDGEQHRIVTSFVQPNPANLNVIPQWKCTPSKVPKQPFMFSCWPLLQTCPCTHMGKTLQNSKYSRHGMGRKNTCRMQCVVTYTLSIPINQSINQSTNKPANKQKNERMKRNKQIKTKQKHAITKQNQTTRSKTGRHADTCQSINQSTNQSINQSINQFVHQSKHSITTIVEQFYHWTVQWLNHSNRATKKKQSPGQLGEARTRHLPGTAASRCYSLSSGFSTSLYVVMKQRTPRTSRNICQIYWSAVVKSEGATMHLPNRIFCEGHPAARWSPRPDRLVENLILTRDKCNRMIFPDLFAQRGDHRCHAADAFNWDGTFAILVLLLPRRVCPLLRWDQWQPFVIEMERLRSFVWCDVIWGRFQNPKQTHGLTGYPGCRCGFQMGHKA